MGCRMDVVSAEMKTLISLYIFSKSSWMTRCAVEEQSHFERDLLF